MSPIAPNAFDRLVWQEDRMLLDGVVFRLQHYKSDNWSGGEHFMFYKIKKLVDQYQRYFRQYPEFHAEHVLELGMFDGGSVAFWHEVFRPEKHVAVDLLDRNDSAYFQQYVQRQGLAERIKTFWNTDQADKARLLDLVKSELDGTLDLVIDDASHLYAPTLASFEALFPLMSSGAIYIIEDWAWGHWPEFISRDHGWAHEVPLTTLVIQLIEAAGTSAEVVSNVNVYEGFIVVERGPQLIKDPASFTLESHILRRHTPSSQPTRSFTEKVFAKLTRGLRQT